MISGNFVKSIQNKMRNDAGVDGDAQRISQMVWLIFLKVFDDKEQLWQLHEKGYKPIIKEGYRWRDWAKDDKRGLATTGDTLLNFVNNELFPFLKNIEINSKADKRAVILRSAFEDTNNYMKNGVILRQIVNIIDEIDFTEHTEIHAFNEIYETILKSLQSAGNAGEFYTPRAVTDFIISIIKPNLDEKIADFACGTGGFLVSALNYLENQVKTVDDRKKYLNSIHGIEKKPLPHLLAVTNLFLHNIDKPDILHGNSLERDLKDYSDNEKFDIIVMNPPYGGGETEQILKNFPPDVRSSETADLFLSVIMARLKFCGRAAVVLPDGFLFGNDSAKVAIKKKLLNELNLHTIIRLPKGVFAPYTPINTNILFFDKAGKTSEVWFCRLDMPEGYKNFSKTRQVTFEHFKLLLDWWGNRQEIVVDNFDKAKRYSVKELEQKNYNFDLCGYPHEEDIILEPLELLNSYKLKRKEWGIKVDNLLHKMSNILGDNK